MSEKLKNEIRKHTSSLSALCAVMTFAIIYFIFHLFMNITGNTVGGFNTVALNVSAISGIAMYTLFEIWELRHL